MSLLDELQNSPRLGGEARDRIRRALTGARDRHFAAVRVLVEGNFDAPDLAGIAALAIEEHGRPDNRGIEVRQLLQIALNRLHKLRAAPERIVRLALDAVAHADGSLTSILGGFLRSAGPFCRKYPALLSAALAEASYSGDAKPADQASGGGTFRDENDWEYNGWEPVPENWPLADLLFALGAAAPVEELLSSPPLREVPPGRSAHYVILRRLWREPPFAKSPSTLAGLGRLVRNTADVPSLAALHDRALAVFANRWRASLPYGLTEAASEISRELGCEMDGANRLYMEMLKQPAVTAAAQPSDSGLLPNEAALRRKIEAAVARLEHQPSVIGWQDLADLYREARDWDRVIEAETHVIEELPNAAGAYYGRGKAWMAKHGYSAAAADFSKAITIWEFPDGIRKFLELEQPQPPYIDSYRTRGMARAHLGDYPGGIADLATALRLTPNDARLHYERAYLLEKAGHAREATGGYHRAGLLYFDEGRRREAERCLGALERLGSHAEAGDLRSRMAPAESEPDLPV